jgi:hypothetical protein
MIESYVLKNKEANAASPFASDATMDTAKWAGYHQRIY